jgi:hypothetical protein
MLLIGLHMYNVSVVLPPGDFFLMYRDPWWIALIPRRSVGRVRRPAGVSRFDHIMSQEALGLGEEETG